jgi:hypothetical protein
MGKYEANSIFKQQSPVCQHPTTAVVTFQKNEIQRKLKNHPETRYIHTSPDGKIKYN